MATLAALVLTWPCDAQITVGEAGQSSSQQQPAPWAPKLYAYGMEVFDTERRSLADEVQMLRELGLDGVGYFLWHDKLGSRFRQLGDDLDNNLRLLDETGLLLLDTGTTVNLDPKSRPYDPRFVGAIGKLKGRQTTICVILQGLPPRDKRGETPAVNILRRLGDLAAENGLRVSIYHHADRPDHPPRQWVGSFIDALELVKQVDHPCVGTNFNVVHWLAVDSDKDYRPLLRANADKIFVVTICGTRIGATEVAELIQPLDGGDFDNRELLATLREIGYRGPIGLLCYGIPGDAREHLQRSMNVWKTWQTEWPKESP